MRVFSKLINKLKKLTLNIKPLKVLLVAVIFLTACGGGGGGSSDGGSPAPNTGSTGSTGSTGNTTSTIVFTLEALSFSVDEDQTYSGQLTATSNPSTT